MASRSGRGRASSRLANEYRCREAVREGKDYLLPVQKVRPDGAETRARSSYGTNFRTEDAERHGNQRGYDTARRKATRRTAADGHPESCEDSRTDAGEGQGLTNSSNSWRSRASVAGSTWAFDVRKASVEPWSRCRRATVAAITGAWAVRKGRTVSRSTPTFSSSGPRTARRLF